MPTITTADGRISAIAFPADTLDELLEQWQQFSEEVMARTGT